MNNCFVVSFGCFVEMWFIASVVTALGAAYAYDKVEQRSEELAIACVALILIGTVVSLIVAPWQMRALLLVALLSYPLVKPDLFAS